MENKINVAELLKDCPKGMELDCTMFDNVTFVKVDNNTRQFPIEILISGLRSKYLTKEGCFHDATLLPEAKCVIFPKGKTTWEGFVPPCKFKVGDKVTHNMGILMTVVRMYWDAECNVIRYDIQSPVDNNYKFKAMLAEHLQPYKEETMKGKIESFEILESHCADEVKVEFDPSKFEMVKRENGYYVVKKQLQYPKTYEECCKVIGYESDRQSVTGYLAELIEKFQQLIICRDAYWKIAGEQMGLGKPWEPDWNNVCDKYTIYTVYGKDVWRDTGQTINTILAFPTEEIRDAFKENFDRDIDACKEFL